MAHPGGRPRKYNDEEVKGYMLLNDKSYIPLGQENNLLYNQLGWNNVKKEKISNIFTIKNRFKTEKEMSVYIQKNIHNFIKEIAPDETLVGYELEPSLIPFNIKKLPNIRADIKFIFEKENWIGEIKNPKHAYTENRIGLSQCMDYKSLFSCERAILISSVFSEVVVRLIENYNLPVDYVLLNKQAVAVYRGFYE